MGGSCKIVGNGKNYNGSEVEELVDSFKKKDLYFKDKIITTAKIIALDGKNAIVNINDKFDSVIKKSDLKDIKDLKIGTLVDVFVESIYDKRGQIVISRSKGMLVKIWSEIYDSRDNNSVLKVIVMEKMQTGVIAEYKSVKMFIAMNQIMDTNENLTGSLIGQELDVIVTKINKKTCNVIASNRMVSDIKKDELEKKVIEAMQPGQKVEGVVTKTYPWGAYVNIGGIDFQLYMNEISWIRIKSPDEVLTIGEKVEVVILGFDNESGRPIISLKYSQPNPWDNLDKEKIKVGNILEVKIVKIADYGAFAEILPGIEGLIHISEITWNSQNPKISRFLKLNETVKVKIIRLELENKRIALSIRQLNEDHWLSESFKEKIKIGSKHNCEVVEINKYGCIVKSKEGIEGLVHLSDFSWTQKNVKADNFVKVGDKIDVVILNVDNELRQISFGIKQAQENPWIKFEKEFSLGSIHKGIVVKKTSRGYIVKFENDMEGYVLNEHIDKKKNITDGSVLDCKIIEYNAKDMVIHAVDKDIKYEIHEKRGKYKPKKVPVVTIRDVLNSNKLNDEE